MDIISNFKNIQKLGSGLSGEVFLIQGSSNPQELYALKYLKTDSHRDQNNLYIHNFKEEFSILKNLYHPHIALIKDFGYDPKTDRYFYTSEYIEGKNLFEFCLDKNVEEIETLFVQILRALEYLHAHSIFHFDLKPQNILVKSAGPSIKLIDFGLAGYKPKGNLAGTPSYMSPEIILGEKADGRADLYSLGIVLYECLTQQNPFRCNTLSETLQKQQSLIPPPPSKFRKEIPDYLDKIILKLLQKNPQNRFSQAGAVIQTLNQLSNKNYSPETSDTLLSYIPGEGIFINRQKEIIAFQNIFSQFQASSPLVPFKSFILIEANEGMGKTRLLKEFRFHAQLNNARVFTYRNELPNETQSPLVFIAENIDANLYKKLKTFFKSYPQPLILIASTQQKLNISDEIQLWKLEAFSTKEVTQYLSVLTGLEKPPLFLIEEITRRSEGNPLFISELIKKLIQEGLLLDKQGRWKASTFEDFNIDFSKIDIPKNIFDFLKKDYEILPSSEKEILKILALYKNPLSSPKLEKILEKVSLLETLQSLCNRDLLSKNETKLEFELKNPQLSAVISQSISQKESHDLHLKIAHFLQEDPLQEKNYLYHFGRSGDDEKTRKALVSLGEKYLEESKFLEAAENFKLATEYDYIDPLKKIEIKIKWGDALLKNGQIDASGKVFEEIREELKQIKSLEKNIPAKIDALEKLGVVYLKKQELGTAREIFGSALSLLEEHPYSKSKHLVLKNYIGRVLLAEGNQSEALSLFLDTKKSWEEKLSKDEQKQVINNDLASVYLIQQNYLAAFEQFQKDLLFYERIPHYYLIARSHYHLAEVSSFLKKTELTVKHYKACVEVSQSHHFYDLLLRAYNGLGNLLNIHKDFQNSITYYERALTLSQKTQDLNSQAAISANLGILYNESENTDSAFANVYQAISLIESFKQKTAFQIYFLIRAKIEMGDILRKMGKFEEARDKLQQSIQLIQEHSHQQHQLFWAHANLAKLYATQGRKEDAVKEFDESKNLSTENDRDQQKELEMIQKMLGKDPFPESTKNSTPSPQKITEISHSPQNSSAPPIEKAYEYIFQLTQFLNAEHNLDFLFKTILNYALDLSGAERALILLLNSNDELEIKASRNMEMTSNLSEISSNIAQKVLQSGEYLETDDASDDSRFNAYESVLILKLRSILCLPIHSRNKTVGVLYLDNRYRPGAFKKSNLKVLQAFCDQTGIAIENAKLINQYEDIQQQLKTKLAKAEDEASTYQAILKEESIDLPTKYSYEKIIAKSKAMFNIFRLLDKITETQLSVFIHGETGTGKELIAKALHYNNKQRNEKRFVALNCGAIPANIMESEIFGHKAGSFTGAMKDKKGLFAEADGGTLFLDEIAELDLNLQVKLLRVLEEGEYTPVGDTKSYKCNVRIVAASHKNLEQLVKEGKFREDLFYRICQIKIDLPPLRDRKEDIPLLADKFIDIYRHQHGITKKLKIAPSFLKKMFDYDWPGNVRELENVISVTTALAENNELTYESLPNSYGIRRELETKSQIKNSQSTLFEKPELQVTIDGQNFYNPKISWKDYEKLIFAKAYLSQESNPTLTAKVLDVSVATLYKRIKDYDLNNSHNPVYQDAFQYNPSLTLQNYVMKVFHAAQEYSGGHPYTAIKWLGVSQGYYYKILKSQ